MELWGVFLIAALALLALGLLVYLLSLRSALREVAGEMEEKLKTDTNTLLSLSIGDKAVKALAAQMNRQLQALRQERMKLQHGDAELKSAVLNISHDLRTPLTAINGYLELLEQEPLPERPQRYLRVIRERTDTMRALTEELLRYSVIVSAEDDLVPEPLCVNDVLEQSLAGVYGVLSCRGIRPHIEMPEGKILRTLDKTALRRIFDNILANAAKYSDGDLSVCLLPDGTVRFENAARALDPVQTRRLFDRFFTVQSVGGSTGLGLSIAKLLTERMGGCIQADYHAGRLCVSVRFPA